MAYSVNWLTKVVSVPDSDLTLVATGRYRLDMAAFRIEVRRLEATVGLWAPQILDHTNAKLNFAGSNYAGFDEVINGYTVQFTGTLNRVDSVGSNNNIADVLIANGVTFVSSNSAGLQTVTSGSGVTAQDKTDIINGLLAAAQVTPIFADARRMNGSQIHGDGSSANLWRGTP